LREKSQTGLKRKETNNFLAKHAVGFVNAKKFSKEISSKHISIKGDESERSKFSMGNESNEFNSLSGTLKPKKLSSFVNRFKKMKTKGAEPEAQSEN
jgi:hypothetical protein